MESQLERVRQDATQKVAAITNSAEAAYYKEDNSIIMIEGRAELVSLIGNSTAVFSHDLSQSRRIRGSGHTNLLNIRIIQ